MINKRWTILDLTIAQTTSKMTTGYSLVHSIRTSCSFKYSIRNITKLYTSGLTLSPPVLSKNKELAVLCRSPSVPQVGVGI